MAAVAEAASKTQVIDVEALLAPIEGENPAGESLQYTGLYDEIREARRADENLEQGHWKRDLKVADWPEVVRLATGALSAKTKDLQISAWLSEALVKVHGFAGLNDSLKLVRGLHERYWENFYPQPDEGDLEARANALASMDRQVAHAIKEIPLTNCPSGVDYSYIQWADAKQFDIPEDLPEEDYRAVEIKQKATEEGKLTTEDWRKAKNPTKRAFYEGLNSLLSDCWAELKTLDQVMDEKFGRDTPGLGELQKSLDGIRLLVENLVKEKRLLEPDPVAPAEAGGDGEPGEGATNGLSAGTGPIQSRQEALRRLSEVAEYFRRAEPHSPISYLVQRAVKWGQMPLESWLQEVIKDSSVLDGLREMLGLKSGQDGS